MKNRLDRWLSRNPMPDKATSTREERRDYFDSMPDDVKREWELRKAKEEAENDLTLHSATADRARKRMARVDALPSSMRAVVHEYSLEVVQEFLNNGVRDPAAVRRMIEAVLLNGYDSGKTFMNCGVRQSKTIRHLMDTVLHAEFPNGQPRFKINKGPNAKRNPAELEDDYFAIGEDGRVRQVG